MVPDKVTQLTHKQAAENQQEIWETSSSLSITILLVSTSSLILFFIWAFNH